MLRLQDWSVWDSVFAHTLPAPETLPEPTTIASWAAAIARALQARGCDAPALFAQAGLDYARREEPEARYPLRGMTRLWDLARAATGDPAFALELPRHVQPGTLHALGLALRVSPSLQDGLQRLARYSRIVSDAVDIALEQEPGRMSLVFRPPHHDVPLADAAVEAFMATTVQLGRSLAGQDEALLACEFRHTPADLSPYERWFGCPVRAGQPQNRLVFDLALLQAPLPGADPQQLRQYDAAASAYLARFDAQPMSQRVREHLVRQLPAGEPTREAVAAALKLTPRTLLRRLAAENANYKELLNDTRRELALSYLRQGRSAAEVTWLLGFADPSNFARAFRRWTGQAPAAWQQGQRSVAG